MKLIQTFARQFSLSRCHVAGGGAVLVAIAVVAAIAYPAWSRLDARRALTESLSQAQQASSAAQARLESNRKERDHLRSITSGWVDSDGNAVASIDRRLLDIATTASKFALVVDAVEPGATRSSSGGPADSISISVVGHGVYPNAVAFLSNLRTAAPDLTIDSVQFNGATDYSCNFRLVLTWWRAPALSTAGTFASANAGESR